VDVGEACGEAVEEDGRVRSGDLDGGSVLILATNVPTDRRCSPGSRQSRFKAKAYHIRRDQYLTKMPIAHHAPG
jgi:hypothetical protein